MQDQFLPKISRKRKKKRKTEKKKSEYARFDPAHFVHILNTSNTACTENILKIKNLTISPKLDLFEFTWKHITMPIWKSSKKLLKGYKTFVVTWSFNAKYSRKSY